MINVTYITNNEKSDINYLTKFNNEELLKGLNFIEINDKDLAMSTINYLKDNDHHDIFISSKSLEILNIIYKIYGEVRLVYEINNEDINNIKSTLFNNNLFTLIIPLNLVNQEIVRKLHKEGIKVITRVSNDYTIYKAVLSGVDGVLGNDLEKVEINGNLTSLPFLVSHRGYHEEYVENSICSANEAYKFNADFLEMDVHVTKDKKVVVIHDETLTRTFNKDYVVKEEDYQTLLTAKMRKEDKLFNSNLPLLSEFDEKINKEFNFLIEVKTETTEEALIIGNEVNKLKRGFQVMSFYPWTVVPLESVVKNNMNGFLIDYTDKGDVFHQILKMVNKHRLTVNPWYKTDNINYRKEFLKRMVEYAPWGIKEDELKIALKEGFNKLNSDYIHKMGSLVKYLKVNNHYIFNSNDVEIKLFDNKNNELDYSVQILENNSLGLVFENKKLIKANKKGRAYLYLVYEFKFDNEIFKMCSDLIEIEIK